MILFRKIVNVFIALVLLIATTGVTLNKHYCMGRLKSIAVNTHATHCFEGESEKMPCCEDVDEELKIEEITKASFHFDGSPELYQVAIISYIFSNQDVTSLEKESPKFQNYSPPLIDRDIPVLIQSFLI